MSAAAAQCGKTLKSIGTSEALLEWLDEQSEEVLVVLDMTCGAAKKDVASLVEKIRASSARARILAFGPHVQNALLESAQAAGCDSVLTRGQFHGQMDSIFAGI